MSEQVASEVSNYGPAQGHRSNRKVLYPKASQCFLKGRPPRPTGATSWDWFASAVSSEDRPLFTALCVLLPYISSGVLSAFIIHFLSHSSSPQCHCAATVRWLLPQFEEQFVLLSNKWYWAHCKLGFFFLANLHTFEACEIKTNAARAWWVLCTGGFAIFPSLPGSYVSEYPSWCLGPARFVMIGPSWSFLY